MRDKRRYILVRIVPPWLSPQAKDLYLSIQESVNSLFGDTSAADIQMAVVYSDNQFAVVRCRRGTEGILEKALATVFSIGEERVAVRTVAVSGTILALKRRIDQLRGQERPDIRGLTRGEKTFEAYWYPGHKVDLLEKGFKSRELLFLTEKDIEEM